MPQLNGGNTALTINFLAIGKKFKKSEPACRGAPNAIQHFLLHLPPTVKSVPHYGKRALFGLPQMIFQDGTTPGIQPHL
jgi:hypothetical protein